MNSAQRADQPRHLAIAPRVASRVDLPKIPLSAETPFTLEAWVTPDAPYLKKQASIISALDVADLRTNSTGGAWYFHWQGWSVTTVSKAGLGANRPLHLAGVSTDQGWLIESELFVRTFEPIFRDICSKNRLVRRMGAK